MGRRKTELELEIDIRDLAHDGRGVGSGENGKTFFAHGALPGERVRVRREKKRRDRDEGVTLEVLTPSADRIEPRCQYFGQCGGCALQHLSIESQRTSKQQALLAQMRRLGGVAPETVLPTLTGPEWGYRRRARLGVKDVPRKGRVLVGFRERRTPYVTDMNRCEVLIPEVGGRLEALSDLVGRLSVRARLPQIEVAAGDDDIALVLRHLDPLSDEDLCLLAEFEHESGFWIYLQPKGPDTVTALSDAAPPLSYRLDSHQVEIRFLPTDFIQINREINRKMIDQALEWLGAGKDDTVLDLFSGLGNFSLPIARAGSTVTAVEGEAGLVGRGRENAERNGLGDRVDFHVANLFEDVTRESWARREYRLAVLDPPRSGAREIIPQLPKMGVERIVYVSCHPATLARDAGQLVNDQGYRLIAAGIMDMFPHTGHAEAMAVFER
ncbi:23S rRNA (uracil(1939)-C(5))-methyltransferase RlmD [Natronospira bacteriovora]|uniref:23S rRNA (uracil(1939)-C(5))-methyltransferase RlmD n=1 Tax=Natronospira bacteriovora TaxID=3069753 RepID=A0ABU0W2N5_9GAMM|nr:23S rRNA (uracil(1939)-C(5))-methyltransferase RlmD [Natronospira sp. AB-CW4]MDQ2068277.1 23S rRNA (uracil(1939)-C(5))-methyltransferase RlmD [Natronospira sp. AB-CW4]